MCALQTKGCKMKSKLNLIVLRIWHQLKSESGQDLIEYSLLAGFLALGVVSSFKPIGGILYAYYQYIHDSLHAANPELFP